MTDLSLTIAPKSDQLNADDLIAGPRTIRITKVSANPESAEQPVSIFFEGDGGKPYRPCKSMRRVLVHVWGKDGNSYPGRSMTLYRDPDVTFGGLAVGGIRISHMSEIKDVQVMALTATKKSRKPFRVLPLIEQARKQAAPASDHSEDNGTLRDEVDAAIQNIALTTTLAGIERGESFCRPLIERLDAGGRSDLKSMLTDAFASARDRVEPSDAAEPESLEMPA